MLASYDHDPTAYTQGLLLHDGLLYESTGLTGQSTLRRWELESGEIRQNLDLPADLFGEGLARVGERLVQLTWMAERALVYRLPASRRWPSTSTTVRVGACATTESSW